MALPVILNPTIAELQNIINVNIANDVENGIDPTDDRAVRQSIVNFLSNITSPQTPKYQGIITGINIGNNNTHSSTHKSRLGVTDTITVTRDNSAFGGGQGTVFKITGIAGFATRQDYKFTAEMWGVSTIGAQIDLENNTEFLVVRVSNSEVWITLREVENSTQNLGVNWSITEY